MSNARSKDKAQEGFSLIEIMVAVTLLTVITVGLLSMFYHTQRAFRIGTSQVDVLEGGRAALRMVALDLQEMYPSRIDLVRNFQAERTRSSILMSLPGDDKMTNLLQNVAFLTRRGNDWLAISYRVAHVNGAGALYRAVLSTNVGIVLTNSRATLADQRRAVANLFDSVTQPATTKEIVDGVKLPFDRIADGVVHFRVHAYNNRGIRFDNTNSSIVLGQFDQVWFTNWVPEYVELEMAILDPKAMEQMRAREDRQASVAEGYLEGQGHRTHFFHQRVQIRSRREEFDLFAGQ